MYVITSGENSQLIQADDILWLSMEIFHFYWKWENIIGEARASEIYGMACYGVDIGRMIIVFKEVLPLISVIFNYLISTFLLPSYFELKINYKNENIVGLGLFLQMWL